MAETTGWREDFLQKVQTGRKGCMGRWSSREGWGVLHSLKGRKPWAGVDAVWIRGWHGPTGGGLGGWRGRARVAGFPGWTHTLPSPWLGPKAPSTVSGRPRLPAM